MNASISGLVGSFLGRLLSGVGFADGIWMSYAFEGRVDIFCCRIGELGSRSGEEWMLRI